MAWWEIGLTALGILLALVGLDFAWPGFRQARRSEFKRQVQEAIPEFQATLTEIRDLVAEQNTMQTILAYHLSDEHGPEIPDWITNHP